MKKNIFFLLAFFASLLTFSQKIKVISNEEIKLPITEMGYNPVLSPAGDFILITGGNLQGLSKYHLASRQLEAITTDRGAGYDPQISADGKILVYRSQKYINKLRYTSLESVDLSTGKKTEVLKATRNLEGVNFKEGTLLTVENGKIKSKRLSGNKLKSTPIVPSVKNGQLYLSRNNKTNLLSPAGNTVNYLWSSVSPDGEKLLYYVIEHGKTYVSNLDGSNPISLGILRAPRWMGNNWVVGMIDTDDGHFITSSKIVAVAANGSNRTELTDNTIIATNPSADANASKIVYSTADGRIFLMKIETQK